MFSAGPQDRCASGRDEHGGADDLRRPNLCPFLCPTHAPKQGPGFAIEGGGDFWIGEGEPPAAPVHVAFAAADRATVDRFRRAGYYEAFVIDPDANNVEAVFHEDR